MFFSTFCYGAAILFWIGCIDLNNSAMLRLNQVNLSPWDSVSPFSESFLRLRSALVHTFCSQQHAPAEEHPNPSHTWCFVDLRCKVGVSHRSKLLSWFYLLFLGSSGYMGWLSVHLFLDDCRCLPICIWSRNVICKSFRHCYCKWLCLAKRNC